MSAKARLVKWQKDREVKTNKNYNGEASPYWSHVDKRRGSDHKQGDHQNESFESPLANPDIIAMPEEQEENLTRKILKRGLKQIKFSKREKQILLLLSQGASQTDVAKRLNVTQSRVAQAILRIKKKGEKFYGNKLADGSLIREEENL